MKKLENLQKYINACEDNMSIAEKEQEKFIEEVLSVYGNEIEGITNHLDMYAYHLEGEIYDYNGDIKKIKSILINYKDNLEMGIEKRKNELELARLKQGSINVSANANNANSINISLTLEQALENIRKISDDILCKEETDEMQELNRVVTMYLDFAEDQARRHIPMYMKNWETYLNNFLNMTGRDVLSGAGHISAQQAKTYAYEQYELYDENRKKIEVNEVDLLVEETKQILPFKMH